MGVHNIETYSTTEEVYELEDITVVFDFDGTRWSGKDTQHNVSEDIYWCTELIKDFWSKSDLNPVKEFYPDPCFCLLLGHTELAEAVDYLYNLQPLLALKPVRHSLKNVLHSSTNLHNNTTVMILYVWFKSPNSLYLLQSSLWDPVKHKKYANH